MKREFVFGSVWENLHAIYFLTKLALRLNDGGREIWIFHKNRSILCKYENRSSLVQSVFLKMLIKIITSGKISMDFWFDQWSTITELPSPKIRKTCTSGAWSKNLRPLMKTKLYPHILRQSNFLTPVLNPHSSPLTIYSAQWAPKPATRYFFQYSTQLDSVLKIIG